MAPLGFLLWLLMQKGYINKLLAYCFGQPVPGDDRTWFQLVNIVAAILGFFALLTGLYFIAFSKEKVEDEMVQSTRLQSFQFAAFLQIIVMIAGFLFVLLAGDPGEGGIMLFFVALVLLFWVAFIGRFNYILHFKYR